MPENVIMVGSLVTIVFVMVSSTFIWWRQDKKAAKTFTIWLFFTVIIALIPIAFNVVAATALFMALQEFGDKHDTLACQKLLYLSFLGNCESEACKDEIRSFRGMTDK